MSTTQIDPTVQTQEVSSNKAPTPAAHGVQAQAQAQAANGPQKAVADEAQVDVTVVLPIYNTAEFLDQALSSAEQNDRINLEILAVNDGSTDTSLEIMQAHAARDPRVRVIDKPNQGYGATMNRGFLEARGTYLAILEPDDWVRPHMYDDLFEYAQSFEARWGLPDIVKTPYTRIWMPNTPQQKEYNCSYYLRVDPGFQPFTLKDSPRLIQHHPSIWSALYKRSFIEENHICFKEVPGAGWVDNPFLIETLCQAKTIVYLEKPYYCYREDLPNSSSVKRASMLSVERWNDMADVMDRLDVNDPGIRASLAVIAFRYVGGLIDDGVMDEPEYRQAAAQIFKRVGRKQILALPNIDPQFKAFALTLMGEPVPRIDGKSYHQALAKEFLYSCKSNSLSFALSRISIFLHRKGYGKEADPTKSRSAGV